MGAKFDVVGAQYCSGKCDFAKADVNVAAFILDSIGEGPFPVIQAYVRKNKINELRGLNDGLQDLVESAIKEVF